MIRKAAFVLTIVAGIFASWGAAILHERLTAPRPSADNCRSCSRPPRIHPDYIGVTLPPNIAPLNFVIDEPGSRYFVRLQSAHGGSIEISGKTPRILIPIRKWRRLLDANRGESLSYDVYVMGKDGRWTRYRSFENRIAPENMDGHLVYRVFRPTFGLWGDISVHQRDLSNWDDSVLIAGPQIEGCVNCHTFVNNNPDSMFLGVRSVAYGNATLFVTDGRVEKIGERWGYTAWHPSGRIAVYVVMKVKQFIHEAGNEVRDVVDLESALFCYDVNRRKIESPANLAEPERLPTYPTWSPDGRHLYYCSAPMLWEDRNAVPPKRYEDVRYDLRRIAYDVDKNEWGKSETVLSAAETGLSILLPRISPDGKRLLFCMCKYGCFPASQPTSDLYMMDLDTRQWHKLELNSDASESWHSWSSNGRWIAFSSKRSQGIYARVYLGYLSPSGEAQKPFVVPREDPEYYDTCLSIHNLPELVTGPVNARRRDLAGAARSPATIVPAKPASDGATVKTPAAVNPDPWEQSEQ